MTHKTFSGFFYQMSLFARSPLVHGSREGGRPEFFSFSKTRKAKLPSSAMRRSAAAAALFVFKCFSLCVRQPKEYLAVNSLTAKGKVVVRSELELLRLRLSSKALFEHILF